MSGLAGVPDTAFSGLVGRASRPSPNSASAPQGSPCEFALCCYFYFQERACSNSVRVIGEVPASRRVRARFGGWASVRGPQCVVEWTRVARARGAGTRLTRALSFRRARVSPRDDAPVEARWVFRHLASRKGGKRQKARIGKARGSRALRERARARARGLRRAYHRQVAAKVCARTSVRSMSRCVK